MSNSCVLAIVFDHDKEKILSVKRRDVPVWVLPGGGIDPGEAPEKAAIREVLEETGLEVSIVRKVGEYFPINNLTKHTHLFECRAEGGELTITNETADLGFFKENELPESFFFLHKEMIQDALENYPCPFVKLYKQVTYSALLKHLIKSPGLVLRFSLSRLGFPINS